MHPWMLQQIAAGRDEELRSRASRWRLGLGIGRRRAQPPATPGPGGFSVLDQLRGSASGSVDGATGLSAACSAQPA
jgi:hypothetical protein